jgi:polyisoprenoid-binding protein YceI
MNRTLALTLALLLGGAANAAPVAYVVDGNHTFPRFEYGHLGFSTQQSRFNKTTGTVVLDTATHSASVNVTIDMASVDTGSDLFNADIRAADFLDTGKFPTATFQSTAVVFKGDQPTQIIGNLTVKGITKPITLTVRSFKHAEHPMRHKDAIGAVATGTLKRSDFGISKYVPMVDDLITLTVVIEAQAQ